MDLFFTRFWTRRLEFWLTVIEESVEMFDF